MMKFILRVACLLLLLHSLQARNWEDTPAEETPPDEAPPDETPPEETPPEEYPPEEYPAEETPPEETLPETPPEETHFPHTPLADESTRCGEVLRCPSGGIFYKPFEAALPNERCTWTISVPETTSYTITIQYFGYEPNDKYDYGLIISNFAKGRKPSHFIPTNTSTMTINNSNLIMVTFFTGSEVNKKSGFVLQYKAKATSTFSSNDAEVSTFPRLIGSGEYATIIPDKSYYNSRNSNPEMHSFVFLPKSNLYREGKESAVVYSGVGTGMIDCHKQNLRIFFFNATAVGGDKWEYQGRTCGTHEIIRSQDMILILFESEASHRDEFWFTYATGL